MSRQNETWFGFNLTQKQSVYIFVLALLGVILSSMGILTMFYPYLMMAFLYPSPYYDFTYFLQMLLSMLPYFLVMAVILGLSAYTISKTRKIAKYYSYILVDSESGKRIALFCPNCGNKREGEHRFCNNCGQIFK